MSSSEGPEIEVEVDLGEVDRLLRELRPRSVGVAAPDGLAGAARRVYELLVDRGLDAVILLDPTYGFCDLQDYQAEALGLDLVINIGHYSRFPGGRLTRLVDVQYRVARRRLEALARAFASEARRRGWRSAALVTTSNYARAREELEAAIRELGGPRLVEIEDRGGPLLPWQVTGCMFAGPWSARDRVDGFAFLGGSRFHAVGVRLSTGKPTLLLDPEAEEVVDVEGEAEGARRRAIASIYAAMEARKFGVVTGVKSGQRYPELARAIGRALRDLGKEVYYYAMTEITAERLAVASYVDAFIVLACPRIAVDAWDLGKPILSYPQAAQLIRALRTKSLITVDALAVPLWAWVGYERR